MNEAASPPLLLRNVRIVLPERIADPASLLIENGRIASILESPVNQSIKAESVRELRGFTLFPGFIDAHIHGAIGVDTMDASADDLRRVGEFLAQKGVTAWMPTLVPSSKDQYQQAVRSIEQARVQQCSEHRLQSGSAESEKDPTKVGTLNTPRARVLGVHYEGPFVNSEQCGALHREHFQTYKRTTDLEALPIIKNGGIHMMTLAPEVVGGIELIRELKKRNWVVSIGHTRADAGTLDEALKAGARHLTHFMNAMTALHHRTLGAVGWGLIHDDVTCDVIADGIHIDRSILRLLVRSKTSERVTLISDAIAATGLGDGDYQIWGEKIVVKDGRTQNDRGSIAGSVITMLDAVRMMLSLGFSECDVAQMAAFNPAKLLGIERDCGSIEQGKRADLVALDEHRNVRLTITSGQIAFQS